MLQITAYQNYREFLKDYYLDEKQRKTGFTYAGFSIAAGLGSPNYFKLVVDGEKNLTPQNIVRFSKAINLNDHESDYFEALVHFNQAKNSLEREYYQDKLKRLKNRAVSKQEERTLEEFEFESASSWLHHAILVLTNVKGFRESPTWIRERLFNLATEEEISIILERLQDLGLLIRNEKGVLVQSHRQIRTKSELKRLSAQKFYDGLLARASLSLRITAPDEREFGAYLVGVSDEQIPELKNKVREFLNSLNEWALENPAPTQVFAMSFCGFPLSLSESENSSRLSE